MDQSNTSSEDPSHGEGPSEPIQFPFINLVKNNDDDDIFIEFLQDLFTRFMFSKKKKNYGRFVKIF
jgi:hypothetical protein